MLAFLKILQLYVTRIRQLLFFVKYVFNRNIYESV